MRDQLLSDPPRVVEQSSLREDERRVGELRQDRLRISCLACTLQRKVRVLERAGDIVPREPRESTGEADPGLQVVAVTRLALGDERIRPGEALVPASQAEERTRLNTS